MTPKLVYLSPGLFDFGGIARYGRYQLRALRQVVGSENVQAISMLGPTVDAFVSDVGVCEIAGGSDVRAKARFLRSAIRAAARHAILWAGHAHYAPIVAGLSTVSGGIPVVNIYGMEIWSGLSRAASVSTRRCQVVADCYATLHHAHGMGIARPGTSSVIWDPVDVSRFAPRRVDTIVLERYGLSQASLRVGFLARLSPNARHKGPDRLVQAFASADLPADAQLVIAGAGGLIPELKRLAQKHGILDRTVFPGRIREDDLPSFYRALDIFVLVSRKGTWEGEGLPLTPIEAAACGTPIIVGDEDGSREAVVDSETGITVPARQQEGLTSALAALARRPRRDQAARERAAKSVHERFSYARFVAQHRTLIQGLAGARPESGTPIPDPRPDATHTPRAADEPNLRLSRSDA